MSTKCFAALAAVFAVLACATEVSAHELPRDEVATVGFAPRVGERVPLDAAFVDDNGTPVKLGQYFGGAGGKPVLLSLNYFHCQYVCPIEEDGLLNALNGVNLTLGKDFTLLTASIDPTDGPAAATTIKARALRGYDRPEGADGWHLLTADSASIQRLTSSVGFNYVPDPQEGDFAHPIGVMLLSPNGAINTYFFGMDFSAAELQQALVGTQDSDGVQTVCYQFDPLIGRYTPLALNLVRIGGGVGFVTMMAWLAYLWRTDLRGKRA
jgi:protein SCO1